MRNGARETRTKGGIRNRSEMNAKQGRSRKFDDQTTIERGEKRAVWIEEASTREDEKVMGDNHLCWLGRDL